MSAANGNSLPNPNKGRIRANPIEAEWATPYRLIPDELLEHMQSSNQNLWPQGEQWSNSVYTIPFTMPGGGEVEVYIRPMGTEQTTGRTLQSDPWGVTGSWHYDNGAAVYDQFGIVIDAFVVHPSGADGARVDLELGGKPVSMSLSFVDATYGEGIAADILSEVLVPIEATGDLAIIFYEPF